VRRAAGLRRGQVPLATDLQNLHDVIPVDQWHTKLYDIAHNHGLSVRVLLKQEYGHPMEHTMNATPVVAFPKPKRQSRRDWSVYADGQIWQLTYDTPSATTKAYHAVRQWAWKQHYALTSQRQGTTLYIQLTV
jgi:hypothetical protein